MTADITKRVISTAQRLEECNNYDDIELLDLEYTVTSNGGVKEVTAILCTGGPHTEVDCLRGVVRGYWGGDRHTTHVESSAVESLGEIEAERFEDIYLA